MNRETVTATAGCIKRPTSVTTGCRCPECKVLVSKQRKWYEAGLMPVNRSAAAWVVLDRFTALGWSVEAIASASGLPGRVISAALLVCRRTGRRHRLSYHTAEHLVKAGEPTRGYVGITGTARRLQALAAMGWTLQDVSDRTGLAMTSLSTLRNGRLAHAKAPAAVAIAKVFQELCLRRGPSKAATRTAAARGWVSTLAWEEDEIDNPKAVPNVDGQHGTGRKPRGGPPLFAVEDIEWLLTNDPSLTAENIACRLGATRNTVLQRLHRAGRDDLLDQLNRNVLALTGRTGRWGAA